MKPISASPAAGLVRDGYVMDDHSMKCVGAELTALVDDVSGGG
jgi:hypothetical protein